MHDLPSSPPCVLMAFTAALLLGASIVCDPAAGQTASPGGDAATAQRRFELTVVDPAGKPVRGAAVQIRTAPAPTAKDTEHGEFLSGGAWGAKFKADADGRVAVRLAAAPSRLAAFIEHPGYGPYFAGWESDTHQNAIPESFTAELEAGWSAGSIIVDEAGQPVEGATVHPSIEFKKRTGDSRQLAIGTTLTTDAAGRWRFDSVPASLNEVSVEINHPRFMPLRRTLVRGEFGLAPGQDRLQPIALDRGLAITGLVTDDFGSPIAGALVRAKFINNIREATTDDDGVYEMIGCEPRMARVVASAKGRAMDLKVVRVEPAMAPVDFALPPGGKIRLRVLDEAGKPIPDTRIFFQEWRGRIDYFEFDHVHDRTDESGVWEWNEAPLDAIKADICRPDGMQLVEQSLLAREEEYIFRPPPALVVSGAVVDAETREPIKAFRVTPGIRSGRPQVQWINGETFDAADGRYEMKQDRGYDAHLVRVEAPGYKTAVSRAIESDEGAVTIDFELIKGQEIAASILTPDGAPAAGAKVAIGIAGSQISVENGDVDDTSTYAARLVADAAGRISVPHQNTDYQLVITHPAGFAHIKAASESAPATINLTAWAKVKGVFRVGSKATSGVPLTLNASGISSYGDGLPSIFTHHEVTTGTDGRFQFPRVFPGEARIGRRILLMVDDGAVDVTSSAMIKADLPPGKTTRIDLGGVGRPVVGKLQPPAAFKEKVLWNFALIDVRVNVPAPLHPKMPLAAQVDQEKRNAWWIEWLQTDEGKPWRPTYAAYDKVRSSTPYYTASVAPDGAFRIDDMPAGDYDLSVRFSQHDAVHLRSYRFTVQAPDAGQSDEPLDLGVLTLEEK